MFDEDTPRGIKWITALYIIEGILLVLIGIGMILLSVIFAGFAVLMNLGMFVAFLWVLPIIGVAAIIVGVLSFIVAWAIMQQYTWARWVAIIVAFVGLFNIPIGTVINALILGYLLFSGAAKEYFED